MIFNNMKEFDYELFKKPTSEYRGLPFWSWNCRLNKDTVDEQLAIFKEMGFGGVVIHPREGLDTDYLGAEFMETIKYAVAECKKMGLICWLYDDDRFPSGAADGIVTKNPHFRARQIRFTSKRLGCEYCKSKEEFDKAVDNGQIPRGYYCTAYSIKTENKYLTEYCRLNTEEKINEIKDNGGNIRFAYIELQEESEWFQGQTYIDTMNPDAVDEFINVTHERYKSVLGDDFGTAASAIFTDEPRIGKQGQISFAESDEDVFIPYTEYLAECFKEKYDFDILDIVPEYVWDRSDGNMYGRYIYREMVKECFSEVFMDKIGDWCKNNGIRMTGHILGEENLTAQTTTVGDAMRTYRKMDIPGVDILTDSREFSTIKQAASVAKQYGREGVMSELYGVTNWDCTFKTYKLQGDWQAALGISVRVPHLSHMTLEGEAKRDWPASIFYQSPWYKKYPYIENHFSRLNTVLTRGKRITKIAVLHPVESMWIKCGSDDVTKEMRKSLENNFKNLIEWLLYNTLDFDYISESLLPEQNVKYCNRQINIGEATYDIIIVSELVTIRDTTLDILEKFVENGGKVIFMGNIPEYVCGLHSERVSETAKKCICIPNDKDKLLAELEYFRDIKIISSDESPSNNLFYHLRADNKCKWLFISHVNKNDSLTSEKYRIEVKGVYFITVYDTITGERFSLPSNIKDGRTVFEWNCYGEDSVLLRLGNDNLEFKEYNPIMKYKTVQRISKAKVIRTEPNVVLLDCAYFTIDFGEIQAKDEILRVDNKIRKQLGYTQRTGADRQPWATMITEEHKVNLFYDIYSEIDTAVQLGIENPHECSIYLNGKKANNKEVGYYVDKSIKMIDLPNIKSGKNELRIERVYNQKTMLENMYILGDFDVRLDGRKAVITKKMNIMRYGDITKLGMPFYTGNIEYIFDIEIDETGEYSIHIPEFKAPLVQIWVDGKNKGLIAYAPHRASIQTLNKGIHRVKVIMYGNRYNGFGTLHNANENYLWYGNGSYRTTGKEWTYDYMLRSVGIMSEIEIEKNE